MASLRTRIRNRIFRNPWTHGLAYGLAYMNLGKPSPVRFPKKLIRIGIPVMLRGVLTGQSFQVILDWVLPYWAHRQFTPGSIGFLPRGYNPITLNLNARNWTAIGNFDSDHEAVVDPRGLVTPFVEAWSLDVWLWSEEPGGHGGRLVAPSRMPEASQRIEGHAPRVVTRIEDKGLSVTMEAWACRDSDMELVVDQVRVKNHGENPRSFYFYFSVRPFNPEGVALINEMEYEDPGLFILNNQPGMLFLQKPEIVSCSNYRDADVSLQLPEPPRREGIRCPVGLCTGVVGWKVELAGGESRSFDALIYTFPAGTPVDRARKYFSFDPPSELATVETRWQERLSRGMHLSFPEERLNECFEANKKYLHLLDDGDIITPGPASYHHFWFRDSAYMVYALDMIGHHESVVEKLREYPNRQLGNGFYLSQEGEWDSAGQGIWPVVEHYRIAHDLKILNELYPSMRKAGEWIIKTRKKSSRVKGPHAGLLPAGFSAEHFGPNDYYYWDNFWGMAGLRDLALAAGLLGHEKDKERFEREFELYREDVEKSIAWAQEKLGARVIPSSPYRRIDSAAVGVLAGVHPLDLYKADDEQIVNTIMELRKKSFYEDGFFQHMVHSGVNVYLTLHVAECYLKQRSHEAWPLANYVLDRATPTWTWPEAFHPQTGGGCMGDGHHGWAVADWLVFLRNLCMFEENDRLVLTPIIPQGWLEPGSRLEVSNAPSYFGPTSFEIEFGDKDATLTFHREFRNPPAGIEWNLPVDISKAIVDGKELEVSGNRFIFSPGAKEVKVRFKNTT